MFELEFQMLVVRKYKLDTPGAPDRAAALTMIMQLKKQGRYK